MVRVQGAEEESRSRVVDERGVAMSREAMTPNVETSMEASSQLPVVGRTSRATSPSKPPHSLPWQPS